MGIFNIFQKRIKGMIGYFDLCDWWLSDFSKSERDYIIKISNSEYLINGNISYTSQTSVDFLSGLASYFNNKNDIAIAYKILKKAESMIESSTKILDLHFLYQIKIEIYYKNRNNAPEGINKAILACKQQIEISNKSKKAFKKEYGDESQLPTHKGFEQLAIIYEKQKNFIKAIEISEEAQKQGWNGDWGKRIERCKKKLN